MIFGQNIASLRSMAVLVINAGDGRETARKLGREQREGFLNIFLAASPLSSSLRGRRLKGKGKGVLGATETRFPRAQNPLSLPFQTLATQATQ